MVGLHEECFPVPYERAFYDSLFEGGDGCTRSLGAFEPATGDLLACVTTRRTQPEGSQLLRRAPLDTPPPPPPALDTSQRGAAAVYVLTLGVAPLHRRCVLAAPVGLASPALTHVQGASSL